MLLRQHKDKKTPVAGILTDLMLSPTFLLLTLELGEMSDQDLKSCYCFPIFLCPQLRKKLRGHIGLGLSVQCSE